MDTVNLVKSNLSMMQSHCLSRPERVSKIARSLLRPFNQLIPQHHAKEVSVDFEITGPSTIILDNRRASDSKLSGTLQLNVLKDVAEIHGFSAALHVHIKYKRPFRKGCSECKHKQVELKSWQLVSKETWFQQGSHAFPFSVDIPSNSKASVHTPIVSIYYEMKAEVTCRRKIMETKSRDGFKVMTFKRTIPVRRRLSIPDSLLSCTKSSPSTGIEVECRYNSIINPLEINKIGLSFNHLRSNPHRGRDSVVWCLQKGSWRLKEHIGTAVEPCQTHSIDRISGRDRTQSQTRVLAGKDFYGGWEMDMYNGTGEMEISIALGPKPASHYDLFTRDSYGDGDVKVSHYIAVELVFIAEILRDGNPIDATRTRAMRMLCTEFRVAIAEPTSEKANWIHEILPSYEDLWPSPPIYIEEDEKLGENARY